MTLDAALLGDAGGADAADAGDAGNFGGGDAGILGDAGQLQCDVGYHDGGNGTCVPIGTCAEDHQDSGAGDCLHISEFFISLPGGYYISSGEDGHAQGAKAALAAFQLGKTPVTVQQFARCAAAGQCGALHYNTFSSNFFCNYGAAGARDRHPMNCVDRSGAAEYCAWAGGRLPTDEEWKYGATHSGYSGTQPLDIPYPWGSAAPVHCVTANYFEPSAQAYCSGKTPVTAISGTSPVGTYSPEGDSPLGLVDMSGNVFEWTSSSSLPASPSPAPYYVTMGGSYLSTGDHLRVGSSGSHSNIPLLDVGFRCARPVICAAGLHDDGTGRCTAAPGCAQGYHDGGDGRCAFEGACFSGTHDNGLGDCVAEGCAGGFHDGGGGLCVTLGTCSPAYHDNGLGDCVAEGCAQNYRDGGDGACVPLGTCSPNYHDNGLGVCVAEGCAQNYRDGGDGACVPLGTCSPNYHDNGLGVCVAEGCAQNYQFNDSNECTHISEFFITIPGGTFVLSHDTATGLKAGTEFTVSAFRLSKTPVTVGQFEKFITFISQYTPYSSFYYYTESQWPLCNYGRGEEWKDHPMNCVSYEGAKLYCSWIGGYLPTELEWEYAAAHDGSQHTGTTYPWGSAPPEPCVSASYQSRDEVSGAGIWCQGRTVVFERLGTSPVGSYSPEGDSPLGLVDMSGNVLEFTSREFMENSDKKLPVKGGSWGYGGHFYLDITKEYVIFILPSVEKEPYYGFRCKKIK